VSFSRNDDDVVLVAASGTEQFPVEGMQRLAAVFDDSHDELRLYLNGVLLGSGSLGSESHSRRRLFRKAHL
jgi:hypothetical protein